MPTNYYVIGNSAPIPDLSTGPYAGYQVVTVDQINTVNASSGVTDGDHVVISDSVDSDILLQPNSSVQGFDVSVTVLENTNVFNIDVGDKDGANTTEPDLDVTVVGEAPGVSIGGNDNIEALTVTVEQGNSIGDITGGTESSQTLTLTAEDNSTVGNIQSGSGSTGGDDTVTLGENVQAGTITLSAGADMLTTGAGTITGAVNMGDGDDSVTIGGNTGAIDLGSGNSTVHITATGVAGTLETDNGTDNIVVDGSIGDINTYGGSDNITINGTAGNIDAGDGEDTITVEGTSDIINAGAGDDLITVNGSTSDTIYGGSGADTIELGDGASVGGDIALGTATGGGDVLTAGNNVTVQGEIYQPVSDNYATVTFGDGAVLNGGVDLAGGRDSFTVGENSLIDGQVRVGSTFSADDADVVNIGAGSTINGQIFTGVDDDSVTLGDGTALNTTGSSYPWSLDMGTGDDTLRIGENVTASRDLDTGIGSDVVFGTGGSPLTVDMNNLNSDIVNIVIHGETEQAEFETALAAANWVDPDGDGVYEYDGIGSDHDFTWKNVKYEDVWQITSVPCFTSGTLILTDAGERAIEDLKVGDLVKTADNGMQPIRWIGGRTLTSHELEAQPNLKPIRIKKSSLGTGLPAADLTVSPQHRMLVRSCIAERMFGTQEALVAAKFLTEIDGIDLVEDPDGVTYYHILFDKHEIVVANGAESESLYTGPEALKSLSEASRKEIFALFPELFTEQQLPVPARILVNASKGRSLARRHRKNSRLLVEEQRPAA